MRIGRRPKAERLHDYQNEVKRARDFRRNEGYDRLWAELREMYQGDNRSQITEDENSVGVNLAFSTINVIYPSVSAGIPRISISANDPSQEDSALVVEEVMNFAWKHWDVQPAFRAAAKDFLMFGHGWTKVGWRFVQEVQPMSNEELATEFQERSREVMEAGVRDPGLLPSLPSDEDIAANLTSTKMAVLEDRPFIEHVSILDMFVNPEATNMANARWVAQRVVRWVEDVKRDENYDAKARKEVRGQYSAYGDDTDPRLKARHMAATNTPDLVELWEFYDMIDGVMAVFATDGNDFLVKPGEMPYHFGHPYAMVRNYEVPDMFYPIGDLEMLWPLQEELNKTRSDMMNYRAAYARKYLARTSAFSRGDEGKIASRKDGEVIWIDNDNVDLGNIIVPMPINQLDPNLFNWSNQIQADINEVSGVSEYARGSVSNRARTATEASLIQDALNARSGEKLSLIEAFAEDNARKLLKIMQQFMTGQQVARILGPSGETLWLQYDRESILGEYDFTVDSGSTQPNNETFKRQKAIAMMNTLVPFVQMQIVDPYELVKHILREGFSVRIPEKFLIQQPPPMDPAQQPGVGNVPGADVGVDAEQPLPQDLLEQQQNAMIQGVPDQFASQLAGQTGLSPML